MLQDRVSNPGPLTYDSGALPIALRGPALNGKKSKFAYQSYLYMFNSNSQFKLANCIKSELDKCGLNYGYNCLDISQEI